MQRKQPDIEDSFESQQIKERNIKNHILALHEILVGEDSKISHFRSRDFMRLYKTSIVSGVTFLAEVLLLWHL